MTGWPCGGRGHRRLPGGREMSSHLLVMMLFSGFVSLIFAVLMKDQPAEQLKLGGQLFAGFVGAALVLGWVLYPFPL